MVQLAGALPSDIIATGVAPFICQKPMSSLPRRHRMSALPSPLKSPDPAMLQASETLAAMTAEASCPPDISHIPTSPFLLRHSRSELPSPSKSATPAICQSDEIVPSEVVETT